MKATVHKLQEAGTMQLIENKGKNEGVGGWIEQVPGAAEDL